MHKGKKTLGHDEPGKETAGFNIH
jgi:hypothetical protein